MVAICTPTRDTVQAGFAFDLVQLVKKSPDTFFVVSKGTLLPNQRTELVKRSIEGHASHVLFIDSDMRFPPDTLDKLLAHKLDIVGANCKHRQANKWTAGVSSKGKAGLVEVGGLGFGVTLIRTDVFMRIAEPWFATPFDGSKFIGEDIFFYHKAKEAGFKIMIDHDLSQEIKHTGTKDY
jgi:hypothetical protein